MNKRSEADLKLAGEAPARMTPAPVEAEEVSGDIPFAKVQEIVNSDKSDEEIVVALRVLFAIKGKEVGE